MELELKKTRLDAYEMGGEVALTQEETAETIVPDYCPDVARVIETEGVVFLHAQEPQEGGLSGIVRVTVLYTPDGEPGIRTLEFTLPFTVEGGPEGARVLAEAETDFLETRLVNPRKLFTRCKLVLRLTPLREASLDFSADVEAEEEARIEKRLERRKAVLLTQAVERDFTFTDEMDLSPGRPGAMELLSHQVSHAVTETKIIGNKLILKGVFTVSLLYLTADGACASASGELPFSQILDLEGTPEDAAVSARLRLTGTDIQIGGGDPDGRVIEVALYLHADALLRQERELELLSDLYSTAYAVRCNAAPLSFAGRYEQQTRRQMVRELLEIGVVVDAILSITASCGPVSVSREEGRAILRTGVLIRVLYLDEGGVPLVTERRVEAECQADFSDGYNLSARAVCPEDAQGSFSERGIEVRFPVEFLVEAVQSVKALCVSSAELDRETVPDSASTPSLVLRRMGREETAWDLAKAYHTTIREILAANRLEDEADLPSDTLLLIPRKRG